MESFQCVIHIMQIFKKLQSFFFICKPSPYLCLFNKIPHNFTESNKQIARTLVRLHIWRHCVGIEPTRHAGLKQCFHIPHVQSVCGNTWGVDEFKLVFKNFSLELSQFFHFLYSYSHIGITHILPPGSVV
jgi:hypothetical protein